MTSAVFRTAEMIYENSITDVLLKFINFKTILTEEADRVLGTRSPLHLYRTYNGKHYFLSVDICEKLNMSKAAGVDHAF